MNLDIVPNWLRILWGLSLSYILCNLISVIEQFTLLFFLLVNQTEYTDIIQKTTRDWINLAQLAAVRKYKVSASIIYIALLLVSIVPVVADTINYYLTSTGEDTAYRNFGLDIFGGYHYGYIHPNDELRTRSQLHSLSQTVLAAQTVIFPLIFLFGLPSLNIFIYVWWAAVDNMIFAYVPTGLYFKIYCYEQFSTDHETQPLLAESASESEE
ncbi:hypothetical protein BDV36DRAFT_282779 [Aspergillus pseudocaelatus]|uniref:Etoposide-induced protein 2.4-domain-containing protein n=1 Tax=Aspergillus pseudocaelatus TaxID=1825620 RepID=A0ABQ6WNK0_9EURO|nr:hypothetical protein BDV36DRAFT_282779 [Aspergillus pseudocaelatus]